MVFLRQGLSQAQQIGGFTGKDYADLMFYSKAEKKKYWKRLGANLIIAGYRTSYFFTHGFTFVTNKKLARELIVYLNSVDRAGSDDGLSLRKVHDLKENIFSRMNSKQKESLEDQYNRAEESYREALKPEREEIEESSYSEEEPSGMDGLSESCEENLSPKTHIDIPMDKSGCSSEDEEKVKKTLGPLEDADIQNGTEEELEESDELALENERIAEEIAEDAAEADFPVPGDEKTVAQIQRWTPQYFDKVARGEGRGEHRQKKFIDAANYLMAYQNSSGSREDEIIPGVYVGNFNSLEAIAGGNPRGFTRVISVTSRPFNIDISRQIQEENRKIVAIDDEEASWHILQQEFEELFLMIDQARKEDKPILIHCTQGQSRSVTLMIAYMVNRFRVIPEIALTYIKLKRFLAEPIPGLFSRLKEYSHSLGLEE